MKKHQSIMVIDDEPEMLQLLRRTFEMEGYDVILAADGVSGMMLLRDCKPDLIILDIMMPGPDGYIVLERIRQSYDIPVIMLTAKREATSLEKALALGADDYVKKPFRPLELMARIRTKLRRANQ
ncbi:Transcriptional regulatory protein WalR [subsurface metagenome]